DEHDRVPVRRELPRLDMDLGHQRAGGVDRVEGTGPGVGVHARRDAMSREHDGLPLGDLGLLLHEDRAPALQALDHVLVVDDLLAHVDGWAVEPERVLDGRDRAINARAVAAGRRKEDLPRACGHTKKSRARKGYLRTRMRKSAVRGAGSM